MLELNQRFKHLDKPLQSPVSHVSHAQLVLKPISKLKISEVPTSLKECVIHSSFYAERKPYFVVFSLLYFYRPIVMLSE